MVTPTTYSIVYTYTGRDNQKFGTSRTVGKGSFKLSGNTSEPIGLITKITFEHYHSATNSSSSGKTFKLYGRLNMPSGNLQSNIVSHTFKSDVYKYTNTLTTNLPTPEQFSEWTGITIGVSSAASGSDLYWRATSTYPMRIRVYFYSKKDLVPSDANPPVATSVQVEDIGESNGISIADTFGQFIQGKSNYVVTCGYTVDSRYIDMITTTHTLTISIYNSVTQEYEAIGEPITQENNSVFNIGVLNENAVGTLRMTYMVQDNVDADDPLTRISTYNEDIEIIPYNKPTLTNVSVNRYWINPAGGIAEESTDGDYAWVTLNANVVQIDSSNEWSLSCRYKKESDSEWTSVPIIASETSSGISYVNEQKIFAVVEGGVITRRTIFDTSQHYDFIFELRDFFTPTDQPVESLDGYIDEAGAFFNVYPDGVSVGMRGTGDENHKKFEVADNYKSYFYGGIEGVTNYSTDEVDTGGKWIDGKPVYRKIVQYSGSIVSSGQTTLASMSYVDTLIRFEGIAKNSNSGSCIPLNFYQSTSSYLWVFFNNSKQFVARSNGITANVFIIVYYTKAEPLSSSSALKMITNNVSYQNDADENISDEQALRIITGEQ